MGDDDNGQTGPGLLFEDTQDLHTGGEVELTSRFVGQHDRVAGGERTRDSNALLFPAGELVREVIDALLETDPLERLLRLFRCVGTSGDVRADLTFSSAVSPRNRLKL